MNKRQKKKQIKKYENLLKQANLIDFTGCIKTMCETISKIMYETCECLQDVVDAFDKEWR
jgi:hypothetical protein